MREYTESEQALLKIASIPGLTYRQREGLLSLVDKPEELFSERYALADDICAVNEALFDKLGQADAQFDMDRLRLYMEKIDAYAVFKGDADFPRAFETLEECPRVLFCKGDIRLAANESIAVVGTRAPTRYGRDVTERFTTDIARAGFTIVSGLARGVDSIAHRAALDAGAPTIGVIGCGIDMVYPAENRNLYDEIAEKGLILSEYYFKESAVSYHFPERNRLISALAQGVLVTEAGVKSGTLITVNYALDQDKDVFIVPGNVFSEASKGTNEMLHNPQCMIACSSEDVLSYYKKEAAHEEEAVQLTTDEVVVYDALKDEDRHFEELIAATGLPMGQLMATLTKLEVLGVIKRLPGNYYGI